MKPTRFAMDVPGSVVTIVIPSMVVQLHHKLFPPSKIQETRLTAYLDLVSFDLESLPPVQDHRWVVTSEATKTDLTKFRVINQKSMVGLVQFALNQKWQVKGYNPGEYNEDSKSTPIN